MKPAEQAAQLADWLNGQEFRAAMDEYRHAPGVTLDTNYAWNATKAFRAVQEAILRQIAAAQGAPADLYQRCNEIIEWQDTAVLPDGALRTFALALNIPSSQRLPVAQAITARQAMEYVAASPAPEHAQRAEVEHAQPSAQSVDDVVEQAFWSGYSQPSAQQWNARKDLYLDLLDVRDWLEDQIDGGEECRGRDGTISSHIETLQLAAAKIMGKSQVKGSDVTGESCHRHGDVTASPAHQSPAQSPASERDEQMEFENWWFEVHPYGTAKHFQDEHFATWKAARAALARDQQEDGNE